SNLLHRPFFFLFLLRPPPISTLFPYTTLFLSLLDAVAPVISLVATRGFRDIRIVVVSFSVTVLVESVCVSATTLISMAGHNAPASWRGAPARQKQIISDHNVWTITKKSFPAMRGRPGDRPPKYS